ncbi:hypothetical protein H112_03549 [Trichophyton rubrum D6]|uniref:Uncharacterized protein n=2 Tax=Trichophyton TaxID=5550 RepID=A0A022W5J5_TRIRU|nr:hypothetical protein H100_03555 [Trichophyton rubrum MR850]EZF42932.1 hypothetical protein H102_03547 [Trichophyton rubrum CBS 100081]EZF53582.1 hypothetical protein H103_03558 [Trichophyton rubrum CBS 288.86]EZF64172.1 hypothetical protein H104_03545 [Trichophyton rubrum CBS 289.86]EZF74783.1 hypothetical protein H105_03571 [Trichophyton soudanense CBS 452.61]EZF85448.1 hypothetical protein H110_03555 [Trichophyton rubrum MR1448]EZF96227.1 hypothetical protein H113_03577 [Trichophyton rub
MGNAEVSRVALAGLGGGGDRRCSTLGLNMAHILSMKPYSIVFLVKKWQVGKLVLAAKYTYYLLPIEDHQEMSPNILIQGRFWWRQESKPLSIHLCKEYFPEKYIICD